MQYIYGFGKASDDDCALLTIRMRSQLDYAISNRRQRLSVTRLGTLLKPADEPADCPAAERVEAPKVSKRGSEPHDRPLRQCSSCRDLAHFNIKMMYSGDNAGAGARPGQ